MIITTNITIKGVIEVVVLIAATVYAPIPKFAITLPGNGR